MSGGLTLSLSFLASIFTLRVGEVATRIDTRWTYLRIEKLTSVRQGLSREAMDRRQTFPDQSNGGVLAFVEIQSTDEPSRLVCSLDLHFNVTLHIPAGGEVERLGTEGLGLLRRISRSAGGTNTCCSMSTVLQGARAADLPPRTRVKVWLSLGKKILQKVRKSSTVQTMRLAHLNLEPEATYSTTAGIFPWRLNPFKNWVARVADYVTSPKNKKTGV